MEKKSPIDFIDSFGKWYIPFIDLIERLLLFRHILNLATHWLLDVILGVFAVYVDSGVTP